MLLEFANAKLKFFNKCFLKLKVGNETCAPDKDFEKAIRVCFAPYAQQHEDKDTYIPNFRKYTSEDA